MKKKPRVFKPRREFRAFLIDALLRAGADLPADPSYKQLAAEIERLWIPANNTVTRRRRA